MLQATARIDPHDRLASIDRRIFGSFVEHLGRCVYGGIHDPGSPFADADGDRADVIELTKELGVSTVRYPGGNFVSGYRWEDGVGRREARPTRLDLAWRSIEDNSFGLHEFVRWTTKAGTTPMMAFNLGTRGIQDACDLVEYANHPGGTALSDRRKANGAPDPFNIGLWCLGNEMDGPWQIGHKTADEYGRLAAETAKAVRQVDPAVELVVCGSSHARMPTFGSWEATVLDHTFEHVDYLSLHAYYEMIDDDVASFLASADAMSDFIDGVVATADAVASRKRSRHRIDLSFDEWNVWYQSRFPGHTTLDWARAPALIEDQYTGLDAVVVGNLLMTLLRHADRVKIACLAQLVNAIAPIRTERDSPAWRQSIYYPFAITAKLAQGDVLRAESHSPTHPTQGNGSINSVDILATVSSDDRLTVFAVNRHPAEPAQLTMTIKGAFRVVETIRMGGPSQAKSMNDQSRPEACMPERNTTPQPASTPLLLEPASWTAIVLHPLATS